MPPKVEKQQPMNVVEIASSDDEVDIGPPPGMPRKTTPSSSKSRRQQPQKQQQQDSSSEAIAAPVPAYQSLDCRSFWKAGAYDVGPIASKAPAQGLQFRMCLFFIFLFFFAMGNVILIFQFLVWFGFICRSIGACKSAP